MSRREKRPRFDRAKVRGLDYELLFNTEPNFAANQAESLTFLRAVNAFVLVDVFLSRAMPRWAAKRIASTWCRSEREKFRS